MCGGHEIRELDFSLEQPASGANADVSSSQTLEQAEKAMIRNALDQCDGNIQRAAEVLGLSRGALYRRLEKYGLG